MNVIGLIFPVSFQIIPLMPQNGARQKEKAELADRARWICIAV